MAQRATSAPVPLPPLPPQPPPLPARTETLAKERAERGMLRNWNPMTQARKRTTVEEQQLRGEQEEEEEEEEEGGGSSNSREGRKNQKDNCLPLGGGVKSQSQGQDPLDSQLSLSTELLKSDSDNNNSDDCGNILPSDIMEFVLNTPSMSMQALGQQPEPSSSELLGYVDVDVNRRKDILFDDFSQPLASGDGGSVVESGVSSSISVEEPYGLPLELPSDLSVLTTRSPSVSSSQNHTAGSLISETSDRTMLGLAADPETISGEKSAEKKRRGSSVSPSQNQHDGTALSTRDTQVTEGHETPEQFIPSPALGQVVESPGNQDLARNSATPGLPSSPSLPHQGQKYITASSSVAAGSPGPVQGPGPSQTQVSGPAVLKQGPEKLLLVNQQFQPLYVLQTLPNGVPQKISAAGVMDTSASAVLSSMTLTTGLNTGLSSASTIFPAGGKVLGTMAHHPQIHTFTGTQTGFQTGIPSTTSGLLIGVSSQPHDQSQILVSDAGRPRELVSSASSMASSPALLASAHGKKRPITRLQPRKTKKLARTRGQPTLAPSEVGSPNMTLINLSGSQITAGIPGPPGSLVEFTTSQRKVPNIIKRPKPGGVMYFEPTTLLQQRMPISAGGQAGMRHDSTHLLPCTVSSLNSTQSVLNVVSVAPSGATGLIAPGSVSLTTPVLSSTEITGSISNLLFKAGPHCLGLSDQPMMLQPAGGTPLMSHIGSSVQTCIASSICVLPTQQTFTMAVNQQGEKDSSVGHLQHLHHLPHNRAQTLDTSPNTSPACVTLAPGPATPVGSSKSVVGVFTHTKTPGHSQSTRTTLEQMQLSSNTVASSTATITVSGAGKGKQKAKRSRQSPDKSSGKKLKTLQKKEPCNNPERRPSTNLG